MFTVTDNYQMHQHRTDHLTLDCRLCRKETLPDPTLGATTTSSAFFATTVVTIRTQFHFSASRERRSLPVKRDGRWHRSGDAGKHGHFSTEAGDSASPRRWRLRTRRQNPEEENHSHRSANLKSQITVLVPFIHSETENSTFTSGL